MDPNACIDELLRILGADENWPCPTCGALHIHADNGERARELRAALTRHIKEGGFPPTPSRVVALFDLLHLE